MHSWTVTGDVIITLFLAFKCETNKRHQLKAPPIPRIGNKGIQTFNLVPFKEFIWVRKHSKDWIRLAQNDCPKIGNWLVIYIAFNSRKLWREQKICLTWPLRTVMVTISFFSQAFSYTTLIGSSPAAPVFSHIVMLLLAIKSAFTVDRKKAKNTRMLCIFIFLQRCQATLVSWSEKCKSKLRTLTLLFFLFINTREVYLKIRAHLSTK